MTRPNLPIEVDVSVEYAVFLGLDVGKGEHHACALAPSG